MPYTYKSTKYKTNNCLKSSYTYIVLLHNNKCIKYYHT